MRTTVSNVNFILIEGAPTCGRCAQPLYNSRSPAIRDLRASAQRDVSTWLSRLVESRCGSGPAFQIT